MDVTGYVQGGKIHRFQRGYSRPVYLYESMKDPARVKLNTRIIFERLLNKKLDCTSEDHLDDQLNLNLPTDIEGDGFISADTSPRGTPRDHLEFDSPHAPYATPQVDRPGTAGEIEEVGLRLRAIGDDLERDPVFRQGMRKCANLVASHVAYQVFEKTVDSFLDSHKQHLPDASERYQVALVFLCLKTALTMAYNSVGAARYYADKLLNNAVNYVGSHFPDWIGTAIE